MKSPHKKKTRVFLVDDHPILRKGLAQLIDHEDDLMVCGETDNALNAIELLAKMKAECVIMDISLKGGMDGIDLIKNIRPRYPDLPILVVSMHDESLYAERALRAGAMGYVMKQEGTEKMITAIRRILSGRVYVSEDMDSRMLQQIARGQPNKAATQLELLSDRELQVFRLLGRGVGSRAIAESLFLSVKTVDSYRANIKEKLQLKNGIELLQHAARWVDQEKLSK